MNLTELDALISSRAPLPPERIYGWMDSQMSIARHYGGLKYQGCDYRITSSNPEDPLVRVDVIAREEREKKDRKKAERQSEDLRAKAAQGSLL